jgi:nucleoside-diphosphate-sugar epimerase
MKTALIIGASGIIGRAHIRNLAGREDVRIIAASRTPEANLPDNAVAYPADLTTGNFDPAPLKDVTHALYCAYVNAHGFEADRVPNVALMNGALDLCEACPNLTHITLMQGNKAYGSHLGPFKTPAKESDPRIQGGHFYDDQLDALTARADKRGWSWSVLRPHVVIGPALKSPMNLMAVLGAYGTLQKAKGKPFAFPGPAAAFTPIYQATDSDILSRAIDWCGIAEKAHGEIFNITNGDYFRWTNVWETIAKFFDLSAAPPQNIKLAETMGDDGPLWARLADEHNLLEQDLDAMVSWGFGDYVFGTTWDVMSDATKIRKFGFWDFVDTEIMLIDRLEQLRTLKIIP